MRFWARMAVAAAAPLILTGCLWGPGKFTSDLALRKDGTFVLDYRGEVVLQMPDEKTVPEPWKDDKALCYTNGDVGLRSEMAVADAMDEDEAAARRDSEERPCTMAEVAPLKAAHDKQEAERVAKKRKENDEMAKIFGLPGSDEASSRRFAENLRKHKGWRSITYRGQGVYDVDYHFEGRLNQDFAFPLMPDSDLLIPFIVIRPRIDGSVKITAPALVGGKGMFAARAKAMSLPSGGNDGPPSRAEGRFTIFTDGEILTNNSEDGPAPHAAGRQVRWDIGPDADKVPEMLVRL
ncbi:MAG TPA: hypothetical protein VMN38_10840 [Sphingomicrobium sp.]|nr:hypothetical protein [Sphingomicrobium sp.]